MKTALSLMLALTTTTALAEPLPVPKPPDPGGSCPHGYIASGSSTPSSGTQETIAKPPAHAPCAAADDRLELLASLRALRAGG